MENEFDIRDAQVQESEQEYENLRLSEEVILLGVSPDSANKFRSRTRQKLCPDQKGGDINGFILQKGW